MSVQTTPQVFLKSILFATDFSPASERALPFLRYLARKFGANVSLVHVCAPERLYEVPLDPLPAELRVDLCAAEERMDTFVQVHDLKDLALQVFVQQGEIWPGLEQIITEQGADLIILGTHGRKGLNNIVLGSVAEEVIRCAPCAVLTVGPHACLSDDALGFRHVLYATDFSPASEQAFAYALMFAQENRSHLSLLHVVHQPASDIPLPYPESEIKRATEILLDMTPEAVDLPFAPEVFVEVDTPSQTILDIATRKGADLIVMGCHRSAHPRVASHAPWHTLHHVVCEAHCPVLTVGG